MVLLTKLLSRKGRKKRYVRKHIHHSRASITRLGEKGGGDIIY